MRLYEEEFLHALLMRNAWAIGLTIPQAGYPISAGTSANENTQYGILKIYIQRNRYPKGSRFLPLENGKIKVY